MAIGLTFVISWFFIAITVVNLVPGCVVLSCVPFADRINYKNLKEWMGCNEFTREGHKRGKKWEKTCTLIRIKSEGSTVQHYLHSGPVDLHSIVLRRTTQVSWTNERLADSWLQFRSPSRACVGLSLGGRKVFRRRAGGFVSYNNMCTVVDQGGQQAARHKRIEFNRIIYLH